MGSKKEERRDKIRRNVVDLTEQFAEADAAQKGIADLRASAGSDPTSPLGSSTDDSSHSSGSASPLSHSGSYSENGSNSEDITRDAKKILSESDYLKRTKVEVLYPDGTEYSDNSTPQDDILTKLPSDEALKQFLSGAPLHTDVLTQSPSSEIPEETTTQSIPKQTEPKITVVSSADKKTFFQQHPLFMTITGTGMSFVALLMLLYCMDRLPSDMAQIFDTYVSKFRAEL
ncbi:MAG TPA: hypothetical protein VJJ26_01880 [Candidatus Babeliales bacterium]|nr:hypothetical protein [Candidatus Babeliales bacterium]